MNFFFNFELIFEARFSVNFESSLFLTVEKHHSILCSW